MAATQFTVKKSSFVQCRRAVETQFEQSVEKDFVLPDYCPDIFRILKCRVYPRIISQSVNGDKAALELEALIKVLYLSENSGKINVLEQKMTYNKTIDLPADCKAPLIYAFPRVDYLNCRVINQRRLDVRGAVSVKAEVVCERKLDFITDAEGAGIQLRKSEVCFPAERSAAAKRITVIEELELGEAKPGVGAVIYSDCFAQCSEVKLISGKAVAKGEIKLDIAYIPQGTESSAVETMGFSVPFSQVIDIEGIDSESEISIDIVSAGCSIAVKSSAPRELECEIIMLMNCSAVKYTSGEAVTDAYSTLYECSCTSLEAAVPGKAERAREKADVSGALIYEDGSIASVSCCRCEAGSFTVRDGTVNGTVLISMIGTNSDGGAIYLENELSYEFDATGYDTEQLRVEAGDVSYQLTSDNGADVKAEIYLVMNRMPENSCTALSSIELDEENVIEKDDRFALKLYRMSEGEKLWDIAKRYKTSIQAMIDENDLSIDSPENGGMLLIPLTK